jgi:sigma-E factor negative regulatory protein RseA
MSDRLRESVSALMDGEADELELRRLLSSESFPIARETWVDLQRVRGGFNGIESALAGLDISARVQSALSDQGAGTQLPASSVQMGSWRWWKPVASVAVAASMAAVVVVGMRGFSATTAPLGAPALVGVAAISANPSVATPSLANVDAAVSPNAGRVFSPTPLPLRGSSTVSATYGDMPGNIVVPVQVYGTAQSRADAEALARKRLQQYLLMQVERASAEQSIPTQSTAVQSQTH